MNQEAVTDMVLQEEMVEPSFLSTLWSKWIFSQTELAEWLSATLTLNKPINTDEEYQGQIDYNNYNQYLYWRYFYGQIGERQRVLK